MDENGFQKTIRDAEMLYDMAMEEKDRNLRDAAEKAWGAVARATDALIIKRLGISEAPDPRKRGDWLWNLVKRNPGLKNMLAFYESSASILHGGCFYNDICEPEEKIKFYISLAKEYIEQVKVV